MEDYQACSCLNIYKSTIIEVIQEKGLTSMAELQKETRVGTICNVCCGSIINIIKEVKSA